MISSSFVNLMRLMMRSFLVFFSPSPLKVTLGNGVSCFQLLPIIRLSNSLVRSDERFTGMILKMC